MSYALRILPAAEKDVNSAAEYLFEESLELALRFYGAVERTFKRIASQPKAYSIISVDTSHLTGFRHRSVIGFPQHLVFFRIVGNEVEITRLLHGARDLPSAWNK